VTAYVCALEEAGELPAEGEADLRYRGQSFELTVPLGSQLAERFHRAHEERYGSADREREIELVAVRTAELRRGPELQLSGGEPLRIEGPRTLELDGATCWIPPGWVGVRDGTTIRVTRL
jgi:N-methylhydantoinase A/oxoprolinase/acetone carboxylase beta subunit